MLKKTISANYKEVSSQYEKLGFNISQALELLLKESKIPFLSISYRTKDLESFIGKIERKNYKKPFDEIEDICGIRIICYYQKDIERIKDLIDHEFNSTYDHDKSEDLEYDQFGYRSHHFIIQVKKEWLATPNYRGLENLKAELQIRTVLMHAWAEIEHKLAYKSEAQIPKEFRRKLSIISAKLEEADQQFEEVKNQIEVNKENWLKSSKESNIFINNIEFNLDSLQAFLDYAFSDRSKDLRSTSDLFEDMKSNKISLKFLAENFERTKDIIKKAEQEYIKTFNNDDDPERIVWGQAGAARTVFELTNDQYFKKRNTPDKAIIERFRKTLK